MWYKISKNNKFLAYNRNVIENNSVQQTQSVMSNTLANNYNYAENNPLLRCTIDSDCMLVQTGWCRTIRAINKTNLAEWQDQDKRESQNAQRENQTCKVSTSESSNLNNYISKCINSVCEAEPNALSEKAIDDSIQTNVKYEIHNQDIYRIEGNAKEKIGEIYKKNIISR